MIDHRADRCVSVSYWNECPLVLIWLYFKWNRQETIHKHKITEKDIRIVKALPSQKSHWDLPRKRSLLQNWPWMSTLASYCLFGLHETAYSEVIISLFQNSYP
jgi:hypothetical protein